MVGIFVHAEYILSGCQHAECLHKHVERVAEEMLKLEDDTIADSTFSADASTWTVEVELTARGNDYEEAENRARAAIRTAVHAAGGMTPEWSQQRAESKVLQPT